MGGAGAELPLHDANDNRYATLANEVILPKGTPTIRRTMTTQIVLPTKVTGEPGQPLTFKYKARAIELGTLRIVKEDSWSSRPVSP